MKRGLQCLKKSDETPPVRAADSALAASMEIKSETPNADNYASASSHRTRKWMNQNFELTFGGRFFCRLLSSDSSKVVYLLPCAVIWGGCYLLQTKRSWARYQKNARASINPSSKDSNLKTLKHFLPLLAPNVNLRVYLHAIALS